MTAIDPNPTWTADQSGGYAFKSFAVTPSDTNELATVINKLYVGGAGNIVLRLVNDSAPVTLANVAAGIVTGLRIRQIYATGTSATGLVGFF